MKLSISVLDDKRPRFQKNFAVAYGPITLAGIFDNANDAFNVTIVGDLTNPDSWISRISDSELVFSAKGTDRTLKLVPLAYVVEEFYTVYFDQNFVTLKSLQQKVSGQNYYVRHSGPDFYNNMLYLTPVTRDQEKNQGTWSVLTGLVEISTSDADPIISLEAFRYDPGFYVIHNLQDANFSAQIATSGPTPYPAWFQQRTSFWVRQGLSDPAGISLESYDFPNYFLSTNNQVKPCGGNCQQLCGYSSCLEVYIRKLQNSDTFKQDSTFYWTDPLS